MTPSEGLKELSRLYGVQIEYVGMSGQTEPAPAESLMLVLRALGADVFSEADVPGATLERLLIIARRRVEPVIVVWDGAQVTIEVRLPKELADSTIRCHLETEEKAVFDWTTQAEELKDLDEPEGFVFGRVKLSAVLPMGYHHIDFHFSDGHGCRSMIVAAPSAAYSRPDLSGKRPWGVFCPLYALHRETSWGAGDFSDLEALIDWTSSLGGALVATLPMLASNFDGQSPIISPYSPTSRIFWNEFYLHLDHIPELARSEAAQTLLASEEAGREVAALKASGLVDYGRQMRLKRAVLEHLADEVDRSDDNRAQAFRDYLDTHPEVKSYAFFQAAGEKHGRNWRSWPPALKPSDEGSDIDPRAYRYHLYAQWQADEQLQELARKAREKGLAWYLDFPIGVDFNSFDVWTHRQAFATGASVGCPPDPVFTKGQNWGFPPLHPDRHRESGYAYLIASIRAHLKYANALRIDHVMGLHRLFWIPQGAEAKDGAFVSTPAEEIYAILSVESHRHNAWLVGEDLGTVPPEVESAMRRHNVNGMYVVQYEAKPDPDRPLRETPEATVASINTHDMPPFAAFWGGLDLDDRMDLGLMSGETLERERTVREQQRSALTEFLRTKGVFADESEATRAVLHALWRWLAASPSSILLLNLEDLWLEIESQNTPNTYEERPNWRRKISHVFESFSTDPTFLAILKEVDEIRSRPVEESRR